MTRALLIGREPGTDLGFSYGDREPYDAVVIGSLTLAQLLRFREEAVLAALAEGKTVIDVNFRGKFGLNIIAIENQDTINESVRPDHVFKKGDILYLSGSKSGFAKLSEWANG